MGQRLQEVERDRKQGGGESHRAPSGNGPFAIHAPATHESGLEGRANVVSAFAHRRGDVRWELGKERQQAWIPGLSGEGPELPEGGDVQAGNLEPAFGEVVDELLPG